METKTQTAEATQGVPAAITTDLVKQYLTKDLSIAISCLNAIQSDPDLLEHLAQFMHGRFVNAKHAESLAKAQS